MLLYTKRVVIYNISSTYHFVSVISLSVSRGTVDVALVMLRLHSLTRELPLYIRGDVMGFFSDWSVLREARIVIGSEGREQSGIV